jgi:hypothetical protein
MKRRVLRQQLDPTTIAGLYLGSGTAHLRERRILLACNRSIDGSTEVNGEPRMREQEFECEVAGAEHVIEAVDCWDTDALNGRCPELWICVLRWPCARADVKYCWRGIRSLEQEEGLVLIGRNVC